MNMRTTIFSEDTVSDRPHILYPRTPIAESQRIISTEISEEAKAKGIAFADEIEKRWVADFEKPGDKMVHVSTFLYHKGMIYMTYYANIFGNAEDPNYQRARIVYCPVDDPENKTYLDVQAVGEDCYDGKVNLVYDTILMQKDEDTAMILWTAEVSGNYYRLYRTFDLNTQEMGAVEVNRFRVGDVVNDFSRSGIQNALSINGIGYKEMFSDIGIMQKTSTHIENGETWYYTGAYSGAFTCIIKSRDFITWEYVSQPDFPNESEWENATYVIGDKVFYFVRQYAETSKYGFLTTYDLKSKTWETPVLVEDSQSRGDFIVHSGQLYLFHAPIDREHIGILRVDTEDIAKSEVVLQAKMHSSCFYPFISYCDDGSLGMSYTVNRQHIRLAKFTL